MSWEQDQARAEQLAKLFHETYEALAPKFGYETREASRKPWEDVPEQNRKLMIAVCSRLLGKEIEFMEDLTKHITVKQARAVMRRSMEEDEGFRIGYEANVAGVVRENTRKKLSMAACNEIGKRVVGWIFFDKRK